MKLKIGLSLLIVLITAQIAVADTCSKNLMPLFTGPQAAEICASFSAGTIGTLANGTYAVARNAANSANINVWRVNSSDDTVINSSAADDLILQLEDDAQRLISFDASSDTSLRMFWGDGGTTASQDLYILAGTANGDDDSTLTIGGGGGTGADSARGAYIQTKGLDVGGADAGGQIDLVLGGTTSNLRVVGNSAGTVLLDIEDNGDIMTLATELALSVSGKTLALQEATAGAACSGTLTANGATPVVTSTTCATTGSRIFLSRTSAETGTVTAWVSAISNGVSFSITSEAADTGTYNWVIFHEAA